MRTVKSRSIVSGLRSAQKDLPPRKGPGRRPRVVPFNVAARAKDLAQLFALCKEQVDWDGLLSAKIEEDVRAAFRGVATDYGERLLGLAHPNLILAWLREGRFPKQRREFLIRHLADSLAGEGYVSFRRSRDVVAEQRRKERKRGRIIRVEHYVECTCGYKGVSRDYACRRCGAPIPTALMSSSRLVAQPK